MKIWFFDLIIKGGLMMYPIILCSVISLGIVIERLYRLQRKNIFHTEILEEIKKYVTLKDYDNAILICKKYDFVMARILKAGLMRAGDGTTEMERAIQGQGNHESSLLMSNLRGLGVIANLAPMMGLLGTVLGMIKAFDVISQSGTGNPGLVASGISEALITTASGLVIGIPSLAFYHFIKGKVNKFILEMEEITLNFIEDLSYKDTP